MPAKNNPNPAKTPLFPRFMPNVPSPVHSVRTKSPSTEIIENSDVLVAGKTEVRIVLGWHRRDRAFLSVKSTAGKIIMAPLRRVVGKK